MNSIKAIEKSHPKIRVHLFKIREQKEKEEVSCLFIDLFKIPERQGVQAEMRESLRLYLEKVLFHSNEYTSITTNDRCILYLRKIYFTVDNFMLDSLEDVKVLFISGSVGLKPSSKQR